MVLSKFGLSGASVSKDGFGSVDHPRSPRSRAFTEAIGGLSARLLTCLVLGAVFGVLAACSGPEPSGDGRGEAEAGDAGLASEASPAEASSAQADAGPPARGDWLVQHTLADPENLNPLTSSDAGASAILNWIFPPLLTLDNETLEQRPLLASELPEVSEDKLTYTFVLREDITFADGTQVTADDVVFTVKAIMNPAVRAPHQRNYFNSVRDAVAVDGRTVRFDLSEKYFRNDLILGSISPMPRHYYDPDDLLADISVADLVSFDEMDEARKERARKFADRFNKDYLRTPMGPGAFELDEIVTGDRITLRRREKFWAPDDPKFGDAWVNRVIYRVINDPEAALVQFKSGDLDVIGLQPAQHKRADTNSARFLTDNHKKEHVSPGYTYIGWNQKRPFMQDVELRRAFGYFVDKKSIIESLLFGLGEPIEGPIYVGRSEYNRNLEPYPFDPERGKALLAEAGWTDSDGDGVLDKEVDGKRVPLRFEIISNSGNSVRRSVGLAVIDEMKRAGIDASFRELDWSIMLERVKAFDFDAVILGWRMPVTSPDLYQVWHSSQAVPGGSNHIAYVNPELDQILEDYRREFDESKRKQLYDRAQEIIYRDQPYTFLFMQKAVTAWDARFRGVTWYPSGGTDLNEWWVARVDQKYTR